MGLHKTVLDDHASSSVLLLDGLDEILLSPIRVGFLEQLRTSAYPSFIITCRPKELEALVLDQPEILFCPVVQIEALDRQQVLQLVAPEPLLAEEIERDSQLAEILRNPLLLSAALFSHKHATGGRPSPMYGPDGKRYEMEFNILRGVVAATYEYEASRGVAMPYEIEDIFTLVGEELLFILGNALRWVMYVPFWPGIVGFPLFLEHGKRDETSPSLGEFLVSLNLARHSTQRRGAQDDWNESVGDELHYFDLPHAMFRDMFCYYECLRLYQSEDSHRRYSALWGASWFGEWGDDLLVRGAQDEDYSVCRLALRKVTEQDRYDAFARIEALAPKRARWARQVLKELANPDLRLR